MEYQDEEESRVYNSDSDSDSDSDIFNKTEVSLDQDDIKIK
jgi:hypothetical protein